MWRLNFVSFDHWHTYGVVCVCGTGGAGGRTALELGGFTPPLLICPSVIRLPDSGSGIGIVLSSYGVLGSSIVMSSRFRERYIASAR
jgi:hypothetical protein